MRGFRMARSLKIWLCAGSAALLMVSCGTPFAVYLPGDHPALSLAVSDLAAEYAKLGAGQPKLIQDPAGLDGFKGTIVYLAVQEGWVEGVDGVGGLPPELTNASNRPYDQTAWAKAGGIQAVALERWGMRQNRLYIAPILWDPWGATGSADKLPVADGKGIGPAQLSKKPRNPAQAFLYAGRDPAALTLAYWLQQPRLPSVQDLARLGTDATSWSDPTVSASLERFAAKPSIAGCLPGSEYFGSGDLANQRLLPGAGIVLESFSAQQALPAAQPRRFRVLVFPVKTDLGSQKALAAIVFAASLHGGDANSAQLSQDFVHYLETPAAQRRLAEASGYLPADFRSPVVNAEAAEARKVAIATDRVLALHPGKKWARLLADVVKAPGSAVAIIRERAMVPAVGQTPRAP